MGSERLLWRLLESGGESFGFQSCTAALGSRSGIDRLGVKASDRMVHQKPTRIAFRRGAGNLLPALPSR